MNNTLNIIQYAVNQEKNSLPYIDNWENICKELTHQAVLPLISDLDLRHTLNKAQQMELFEAGAGNIQSFHELMSAQAELIDLLNVHHIPVAVMKGAAAAKYYPSPELRAMGDIDILVLPEDYDRTFQLLCASGYKNGQPLDHICQRHIDFRTKNGIEIELHRYFSSGENKHQNDLLDGWLYEKIHALCEVNVSGYQVPVFPELENGLILLGHIVQHLCLGLGLRQIIDWMMYVKHTLDDDFWEEAFKEKAMALGMDKPAKIVTKMCQKYLGLSDEVTWCEDAEDDIADELMAYIMRKGNFGRKIETGKKATINVMSVYTSLPKIFRYLTKGGMIHMQEAGLKPVKCLAWIYQIGHLSKKTINRKGDVNLAKEFKCSREEREFLKKMGVI